MLARVPWSPTIKSKPKPRQINRDRKRHLIGIVAAILKTGEPTTFAFEASCRSGLRSGLCMEGWSWQTADDAAAEIVGAALKIIGARRPTWQQGQPGWTEEGVLRFERENCARCRKPISEDRNGHGIPAKYCSVECTRAAKVDHYRKRQGEEFRAAHAAFEAGRLAKKRAAMPEKACSYCSGIFRPMPARPGRPETIFCSPRCRNKARSRLYDPEIGTIVHKRSRWDEGMQSGLRSSLRSIDKEA